MLLRLSLITPKSSCDTGNELSVHAPLDASATVVVPGVVFAVQGDETVREKLLKALTKCDDGNVQLLVRVSNSNNNFSVDMIVTTVSPSALHEIRE